MKEMQWVKECHEMLTCAHRKIVSTFERYDFLAVLDYKMWIMIKAWKEAWQLRLSLSYGFYWSVGCQLDSSIGN